MRNKKRERLSFYTDAKISLSKIEEYREHVRKRRSIYEYIERYQHLPVGASVGEEWDAETDRAMHFCNKIASTAEPNRTEEFINGETKIFKLRVEQMAREEVLSLFAAEYLPRLQEKFAFGYAAADEKEALSRGGEALELCEREKGEAGAENRLVVRIDGDKRNWIGLEKINAEDAASVGKLISRGAKDIRFIAHFTHYYEVKEKIERGVVRSGVEGARSIMVRAFNELLRNTTNNMRMSGLEQKYAVREEREELSNEAFDEKHAPPCMKKVLENLRATKHLKYEDRTNLANFMKNVGVPLEDTILMFKKNFACAEDRFEKEYRYRIRHIYGKEGSKINYQSVGCVKIIRESGQKECSGCPFARSPEPTAKCAARLAEKSRKYEIPVVSPVEYYKRSKQNEKR